MNKKLHYTTTQYNERLTSYAGDTVDMESLNGLFKYKVNKNENPTIVEIVDDYYKIYTSQKPSFLLKVFHHNRTNPRDMFFAKVYISNDDVIIKVLLKKQHIIMLLIILGLFAIPSFGKDGNNEGLLFFIILFIFIGIVFIISKRRYKSFIINFMNNL